MKNVVVITIMLGLGLAITGCKTRQPAATIHTKTDTSAAEPATGALLARIEATQVPYTWFSATGQGKIDWDGQRFSARINVRIRRDSIIWVQINKLGFEVGRMLVTPDSAFFINRLERTYSRYSTVDFLKEYNVPADFEMFSRVFTAGAYMPSSIQSSQVETDGSLLLRSVTGLSARHWFDASSLLIRSLVIDPLAREWSAVYADYKKTDTGYAVPYKRSNTLMIDGRPNIFDLEYTSLQLDIPLEFPFSIPSHYEKI